MIDESADELELRNFVDCPTRSMPPVDSPEVAEDERSPVVAAPPAPRIRRRFALGTGALIPGTPYRVRRWLGDGGMGAVFEAEHVDIERRVAVKLLHSRASRQAWITQGFRNEARASARIGSPYIVEILDFKELEDGRLLIAMEFLDGVTLRTAIAAEPMPLPRIVGIARQICKGLQAAHDAGIVHCDIKPENVMVVQRQGRGDFVKIVDFGVARFARDHRVQRVVGTAQYMAPEVSWGEGDARVDIYALGCLLHELAVGEPVFEGSTSSDIIARHYSEPPVPPSQRAKERALPPGFDALVDRCLRKAPEERPQTAAEVEAALCELQIEHGWVTPWDDLEAPAVEAERRAEIEAGLASLRARGRRRRWWPWLLAAALLVINASVFAWWSGRDRDPPVDEVDGLTAGARAAAARFYFVYPPHDDPAGPTAYRKVLALEALDRTMADERAGRLRKEFGSTLVRLGDRYWDFPSARPFAYEYYAWALMFADDPRALSRIDLTPVALERLRAKAARGDFTEHELLASEALAALAEPDPQRRVQRLVRAQQNPVSVSVARSIDRVLAHERSRMSTKVDRAGVEADARTEEAESAWTEATPAPIADAEVDGAEVVAAPPSASDETPRDEPPRDEPPSKASPLTRSARRPGEARTLATQAQRVRRDGDLDRAEILFHRALAADRRSLAALDGLGSIAFSRAQYEKSVKYFERAAQLGPSKASRWISLGDAYFKNLRYEDAAAAYERARDRGSAVAGGRIDKVDRKLGRP
ncbi:MAG: serine/threonine-protein kinase [Myxococcota bacterium]